MKFWSRILGRSERQKAHVEDPDLSIARQQVEEVEQQLRQLRMIDFEKMVQGYGRRRTDR